MSDISLAGVMAYLALFAAVVILLASGLVFALRRAVLTRAARLPVAAYAVFAVFAAAQPFLDLGTPDGQEARFWFATAASGLAWAAIALRAGLRPWLRDSAGALALALLPCALLAAVVFH